MSALLRSLTYCFILLSVLNLNGQVNGLKCYVCRGCLDVNQSYEQECPPREQPTTTPETTTSDTTTTTTTPTTITEPTTTPTTTTEPTTTTTTTTEPTTTTTTTTEFTTTTTTTEPTTTTTEPTTTPTTTTTTTPTTTEPTTTTTTTEPTTTPTTTTTTTPTTTTTTTPTTTSEPTTTTTTTTSISPPPEPEVRMMDRNMYSYPGPLRTLKQFRDEIDPLDEIRCVVAYYEENGETSVVRGCSFASDNAADNCREAVGDNFTGTLESCRLCATDLCNSAFKSSSAVFVLLITVALPLLRNIL